MNGTRKRVLLGVLGVVIVLAVLVTIYHVSQRETYLSDDPLFGSFTIGNRELVDNIYPADFLLSIDVAEDNETLVQCAEKNNVDISKGCWVYSFGENKVFRAEKEGNKLNAYENGKVIGVFTYTSDKILWMEDNEKYTANWRGRNFDLTKILQGFIYP